MSENKIFTLNQSPELSHTSGYKTNAIEGKPYENCWVYDDHSSGNFRSGIWECKAGSWSHEQPKTEFCYIVEGTVKIQKNDGSLHEYNTVDSFITPKGTHVTGIVEDYVKNMFVGAEKLEHRSSHA